MKLTAEMTARIEAEIASLPPAGPGHINYEGHRYHALPLGGTIGEVWLLRADGTLWRADSDFGRELEALPNHMRTIVLVAGTERYPWLHELLPRRPPNALPCTVCSGAGRIGANDGNAGTKGFFCPNCNALGWTAPASAELTAFERAAVEKLLAGSGPLFATLRDQLAAVQVARRDYSGVGCFVELRFAAAVKRIPADELCLDGVDVTTPQLAGGGGLILYVTDGVLRMLECFCYLDEPWPETIEQFQLVPTPGAR